jgi:RHS repeat-associated protein
LSKVEKYIRLISYGYEYDSHGYLKQVVDKLGNISKTTFDENGLLVEQVSNVGSKEEKTTLSSYDTNLRKPLRVLENGVVNYYAYDKNGQLTSSIEAVGNILAIDNQNFAYDALYRLTNYQNDGKIQAFGYDKNANRTAMSDIKGQLDVNTSYNYKTGTNQLSKIEKIDKNSTKTTTNFLYNENGNLLKDASHEYIYDKKARLVSVDNNVSYAYNYENTRISKTINAETTHFIYDGAKLIGEYNSDGSVKNEYIYLDNIPVGVIPRGYPQDGVKYIHADHLGTPRRLADENGNIVWSWESKAFGDDEAVGSMKFNLRFAGQYYDNETKTHYNINRDYNPKTGRYIESDPIGFDGGVNSYG